MNSKTAALTYSINICNEKKCLLYIILSLRLILGRQKYFFEYNLIRKKINAVLAFLARLLAAATGLIHV